MKKNYIIDTNVLLDAPNALQQLRNGNDNQVFIPYHVLLELNKLKREPRLAHLVSKVVQHLSENPDDYHILNPHKIAHSLKSQVDRHILSEIRENDIDDPILVTNDRIMKLQAAAEGIQSEPYRDSVPFKSDAEYFTGFVGTRDEMIPNAFMWNETGKPVFLGAHQEKVIDFQHRVWNVVPRNIYQNLALDLLTNEDIHVVSIQSEAGYGKSYLALATAFYLTLEKKTHDKIFVVKPMIEIGQKLGYLPGKVEEKMEPYTRYIIDLAAKLHKSRPANKIFSNPDESPLKFNSHRIELLPLAYIRGMNIENAVVIIDEIQNMSRTEVRAMLSRMGEGVKCICLGDTRQVDNPYLNMENNGMNWVVNKFKGNRIYAHMVLKGEKSRGPITDLVIKSGL